MANTINIKLTIPKKLLNECTDDEEIDLENLTKS